MALKKKTVTKKPAQPARRTTRTAAVPARVPAAKPQPVAAPAAEKAAATQEHEATGDAAYSGLAPAPTPAADNAGQSSLTDLISAADADEAVITAAADAEAPAGGVEAMTREAALELASGGVMVLLKTGEEILTTAYPFVQVPKEKLQKVADAGAPLMLKYSGGEPPAWLNEWKEEILFLVAVGGLTFSVGSQIRQHEIAELKALEQRQKARELAQQNANRVNQGQEPKPAPAAAAPVAAPAPVARVDLTTGDTMAGIKASGDL